MTLLPSRLLPSALLGKPSPARTHRPVSRELLLGDAGKPAPVPTLLIAVFDNSGSVIGPTGNDPLSNRFAEVEYAFRRVSRKTKDFELGAVLHFDSPTSGDVPPVQISKRNMERLRAGLAIPSDGAGSSALRPSMRLAVRLAEAHPEHATTFVVLSDFELLDVNPVATLKELAAFPGNVHAVVLGGYLAADAFDPRIAVTPVHRHDSPGAVARALFASLVTHRPGSRVHQPKP